MTWLSHRDVAARGQVQLFCLPHAGSGASGFYRWKRLLPESIAVCPVLLPGRESRLGEPPLRSVAEIVSRMHAELRPHLANPYAIFGHSMSSLIAFEWARLIEREGLPSPLRLFVSGRNAPQLTLGHRELHRRDEEEMLRELGRLYGGNADILLAEPELRELYVPILRADLAAVENYQFFAGASAQCPVRAYAGADDRSVSAQGLDDWSQVASRSFASKRFPGDHFYHLGEGQSELLAEIVRELTA